MRLHGDKELYASGYSGHARSTAGQRAHPASVALAERPPRDVYCYFDNTDVKLRAPFDAQTLMRKLGLTVGGSAGHHFRQAPQIVERPMRTGRLELVLRRVCAKAEHRHPRCNAGLHAGRCVLDDHAR